jgi:hypothetical protein
MKLLIKIEEIINQKLKIRLMSDEEKTTLIQRQRAHLSSFITHI